MPITDWPQEDRPREKLLSKGEHALTDAELIAILLQTGQQGKTALDISKELLQEFGTLKKLFQMKAASMLAIKGLGPAKFALLKAGMELGRRSLQEKMPLGILLNNSQLAMQLITPRLREYANEVFACLFLDTHCKLISFEEVFQGTVNEANVYPREILRRALMHNAAKIILAHNHPSGFSLPSEADKEITRLVKKALVLIDVELVDHIIIGDPLNFSFADAGILM